MKSAIKLGKISDVHIWDCARTQSEIQADRDSRLLDTETDQVVFYYKLEEDTRSPDKPLKNTLI